MVTSLGAERSYQVYCARGDWRTDQGTAAGAVRRSHLGAECGPTSCACISVRLRAAGVTAALGPVGHAAGAGAMRTIRLKLLKIGVGSGSACGPCGCRSTRGPEAGLFGQVLARLQSLPLRNSIVSSPVGGRRGSVRLQGELQEKTSPNNRGIWICRSPTCYPSPRTKRLRARKVLVAPAFSQKVLNSAAIEPRITLLRFDKGP